MRSREHPAPLVSPLVSRLVHERIFLCPSLGNSGVEPFLLGRSRPRWRGSTLHPAGVQVADAQLASLRSLSQTVRLPCHSLARAKLRVQCLVEVLLCRSVPGPVLEVDDRVRVVLSSSPSEVSRDLPGVAEPSADRGERRVVIPPA